MNRNLFSYHLHLAAVFSVLFAASVNISAKHLPYGKPHTHFPHEVTAEDKPYMTREFTIDGPGILKVFTLAGDIEVEHVANTQKVRVELFVDRGYAFWSNTKNLDNYRITMVQRGNEIVASVESKTKETGFFSDQMKFSYKVYVPASMSTELKSSGGHIKVGGVKGEHLIKTSGGNINIRDAEGKIAAYTSGGNIDILSSTGTIYAQTEGGNMVISRSSGELRLKTNGGRISAEHISGTMLAKVDGGDIRADFLSVSQGISLETTAGNIYLNIPGDSGYNLFLRGTSIRIPENQSFEGIKRTNRVEGTFNSGGAPVNLTTEHGTITLDTERN